MVWWECVGVHICVSVDECTRYVGGCVSEHVYMDVKMGLCRDVCVYTHMYVYVYTCVCDNTSRQ